jgi:pyruvate kinase
MLPDLLTPPQPLLALQVSDIAIAVREGTDAVMLSGESAYGQFPYKAVDVMCTVAKHTEASMLSYAVGSFAYVLAC